MLLTKIPFQQLLLTFGLAHEKSSRATNMVFSEIVFALIFDKLLWGTSPSLLSIGGGSLILGSTAFVAVKKNASQDTHVTIEMATMGPGEQERGLPNFSEMVGHSDDESKLPDWVKTKKVPNRNIILQRLASA